MGTFRLFRCASMTLATVGLLLPASPGVRAAERLNPVQRPATSVIDVELGPRGRLEGLLIDAEGQPIEGARITLRKSSQDLVGQASTDRDGKYVVGPLQGGVYEVGSSSATAVVRLWAANTAPPAAESKIVLVHNEVVRGQYPGMYGGVDGITAMLLATSITGVVLGAIVLDRVNGLEAPESP